MNRKKVIIIGIEILIFLGGAFLVAHLAGSNKPPKQIFSEAKENIKDRFQSIITTHARDNQNYNRAIHYANEQACEDISDENKKTECQDNTKIAKFLQNPETADCSIIWNESRQINCKNLMYEKTATDTKNKNLCSHISDTNISQRCRENIDANILSEITKNNTANEQICSKLENNFQKECKKLIENYKMEATYTETITKENIEQCQMIGDTKLTLKCRDEILYKKALKENLDTLCSQIQDINQRNFCLSSTQNQKDAKNFEVAIQNNHIEICNSIINTDLKNRCYDIITLSIIQKTKNIELCKTLKNTGSIKTCEQISKL